MAPAKRVVSLKGSSRGKGESQPYSDQDITLFPMDNVNT